MQKDILTQFSSKKFLNELDTAKIILEHEFQVQETGEGFLSDFELKTLQENKYLNKDIVKSVDLQLFTTQYYLVQLKAAFLDYESRYHELDIILRSYDNMCDFLVVIRKLSKSDGLLENLTHYLFPIGGYAFMKYATKIRSIDDFYHYSSIMHAKEKIIEIVEHLQHFEKYVVRFATLAKESSMFKEQYRFPDFYTHYTNLFAIKKGQIKYYFESLHELYDGNVIYWYSDIIDPVIDGIVPEYDGFLKGLI